MKARWVVLAASATVAGAGIAGLSSDDPAEIRFLAVGQGDCIVIRSDGLTAMIDSGPTASTGMDAADRIILPSLRKLGVDRIDLLMLTHPDADHVGGLPTLAARIPIGLVVIPGTFRNSREMIGWLERAGVNDRKVMWLDQPQVVGLGHFRLAMLAPPTGPGSSDNEGSLFVKAVLGQSSAVFTGDADEEAELRMEERYPNLWGAQLLKAGHHGSRTSTSLSWMLSVKPTFVVFSCGRGNRYGHPSPEIVQRVHALGARDLRTDRDGTLVFRPGPAGFEPVR